MKTGDLGNRGGIASQDVVSASVFTFSAQVFIFFFSLCNSVILARALGPEGRGAFALVVTIVGLMTTLGGLGLPVANVYYSAGQRYNIADIVGNSLVVASLAGILLLVIGITLSQLHLVTDFFQKNLVVKPLLWAVLLVLPLMLLASSLSGALLGYGFIGRYNLTSVLQAGFQLAFSLLLLVVLKQGLPGAVSAYIFTTVIETAIFVFWISQIAPLRFRLHPDLFNESIRYGLKANVGHLAQSLNYRLDMFLVAYFLGPAATGFYAIAVGIVERLWMIPAAVGTVLFPTVSALDVLQANVITPQVVRHVGLIICLLGAGLALMAKPLVLFVFGVEFADVVLPLLFLLPGIIGLSVGKVLANDLAGRGRPEFWTIGVWVSLFLTVIFNLLLIPRWGIVGAAIASSLAYILTTAIMLIAFIHLSKIAWTDLLIKKSDLRAYAQLFRRQGYTSALGRMGVSGSSQVKER